MDSNSPQSPDAPKNRLLRLVVGMVIITLGIVLFMVASNLYKKAEADDARTEASKDKISVDSLSTTVK